VRYQARKSTTSHQRQEVLVQAILLAAEGKKVTIPIIKDAFSKVTEEISISLGLASMNHTIIQGFFNAMEVSTDTTGGGGTVESGAGGVPPTGEGGGAAEETTMKQILARISSIEELVGKSARLQKVAHEMAGPPKADEVTLESMPGDGKCLYWALAAVEAMMEGKKIDQVKYDTNKVEIVKAQIVANAMDYRELLETDKNNNVDEEWMKLTGEDISTFCEKVMSMERIGNKNNWGGHVEAMLYGWHREHALLMVDADNINRGMSIDEARKLVNDAPWPKDKVLPKRIAIAVLSKQHYYLLTMNGEGLFDHGDEHHKALDLCLKKIMAEQETEPAFNEIAKIKDKEKRMQILRERMSASSSLQVNKNKKKKSTKTKAAPSVPSSGAQRIEKKEGKEEEWQEKAKENGWERKKSSRKQKETEPENWAKIARENGWEKVSERQQREETKRSWANKANENRWEEVNNRKQKEPKQAIVKNSVLIYTEKLAEEILTEIMKKDKTTSKLIQSTRQKQGHVILMATQTNDTKLRERVPWIKQWGYSSREYRQPEDTLSQVAETGMRARVKEDGMCTFFAKHADCPFGNRCKFTCYPKPQRR
jgi:hypothetical protein